MLMVLLEFLLMVIIKICCSSLCFSFTVFNNVLDELSLKFMNKGK
jgi:hypothetical protein